MASGDRSNTTKEKATIVCCYTKQLIKIRFRYQITQWLLVMYMPIDIFSIIPK